MSKSRASKTASILDTVTELADTVSDVFTPEYGEVKPTMINGVYVGPEVTPKSASASFLDKIGMAFPRADQIGVLTELARLVGKGLDAVDSDDASAEDLKALTAQVELLAVAVTQHTAQLENLADQLIALDKRMAAAEQALAPATPES
jgi:hypothetical protein